MSDINRTDDELRKLNTEFNELWTDNEENWARRNKCFFLLCDTEDEAERERIKADLKRIEQLIGATETSLNILHAMIYPPVGVGDDDDADDDDDDRHRHRQHAYMGDCC